MVLIGLALLVAALTGGAAYRTRGPAAEPPARAPLSATFAGVSLSIELATTTAARELGLGGRASVPEGYGMLFVFATSSRYGFWMKDMRAPIDIFWLDDAGRVVTVAPGVATSTYPHVFYPSAPARYVLETAAGFARAHGVATGMPLVLSGVTSVSE
jgi:uncharacterized membrane protein (UPF0127 family)